MGAGTGLLVFVSTLLYMRRKAKGMKPRFEQGQIRFPESDAANREPELVARR
jgi:hypothetical protein